MAGFRALLAPVAADVVGTLVRTEIAAYARRREVTERVTLTGIPSPQAEQEGCPVCVIHRSCAEASALLEGLAAQTRPTGHIPPGIGGTIPLAARKLQDADDQLVTVAAVDARLQARAVALQGRIRSLQPKLQREVTAEAVPALAQEAREAWEESYELAAEAFRQPEERPDPLVELFRRVREENLQPDAATEELRRIVNEEPPHV